MEGSIKKLDRLLKLLADSKVLLTLEQIFNTFKVTYPDIEQLDVQQLVMKLYKDDYASLDSFETSEWLKKYDVSRITTFGISLNGIIFLESGGYTGQKSRLASAAAKELSETNLNKTLQYVIAGGGAVAALYYLSELGHTKYGWEAISAGGISFGVTRIVYFFFGKQIRSIDIINIFIIIALIVILFYKFLDK